ncbi:MAG: hypothetical protein DRI44_02585 [Chlamydiae bacterium]|nr:MAG: hypothetical protein DRI44_02585 [Chlamydiota bacterium]
MKIIREFDNGKEIRSIEFDVYGEDIPIKLLHDALDFLSECHSSVLYSVDDEIGRCYLTGYVEEDKND